MSGVSAGSVFVSLFGKFDHREFDKYDERVVKAKRTKEIKAKLGGDFDASAFDAYERKATEVKKIAADRKAFKAVLGADYNAAGFNAYRKATADASKQTRDLDHNVVHLSGHMNVMSNIMKFIKWPAFIAAAGIAAQAISALSGGVVALTGALVPMVGAIGAVPALASAAGQGLGVFKLASLGVSDALKAQTKAQDGTKASLKAYDTALKGLAPEARKFVVLLGTQTDKVSALKKTAAGGFFPGATAGLRDALKSFGVVEKGVGRTSKVLGGLVEQAGKLVGSKGFGKDLDTQMGRNDVTIRRLGEGGLHLADALRHVTLAAGPLVDWLTKGALRFTELIDKQAKAGRESGKLAAFFHQTQVELSRLGRIVVDFGTALFNITKLGKPLGDDILVSLVRAADAFRKWTESAKGKNAIAEYFREAKPAIFELGRLMRDVTKAFFELGRGDQVAPLLRTIRVDLLPAFVKLVDGTTKALGPALLETLKQVILLFTKLGGSSGPLVQLVTLLGKMAEAMNNLLDKFPLLNTALVSLVALGGIAKALKIGAAITGMTSLIGLLKTARGIGAAGAAGEAAGGAGGGALAGGGAGALLRKLGGGSLLKGAGRAGAAGVALDFVINLKTSRGNPIAAGVNTAHDLTFGIVPQIKVKSPETRQSEALRDLNSQIDRLAAKRDTAGLEALSKGIGRTADEARDFKSERLGDAYDKLGTKAKQTASDIKVDKAVDKAKGNYLELRRYGNDSLNAILKVTKNNMADIRHHLDARSAEGKEALAKNFRAARAAIKDSMDHGRTSVKEGLAEIQTLMRKELAAYGITGKVASSIIKHGGNIGGSGGDKGGGGHASGGRVRRASGGWIGQRGMVSDDIVPIFPGAVAAYGEYDANGPGGRRAILNRHQVPYAEMALAAGGYPGLDHLPAGQQLPIIEQAFGGAEGLDALFAAVTRPHYLAQGGRFASGGGVNLMGSKPGLAGYARLAQTFGLSVTSGARPGAITSSGNTSLHASGDAVDINAGPADKMLAFARMMSTRYGAGLDELIHTPLGALQIKNGQHYVFTGQVAADHYDHVHVGDKTPGAVAAALRKITAPITGAEGALGAIVQGALNAGARGANALLEAAAGSVGGGDVGSFGVAGGGDSRSIVVAGLRLAGLPASAGNVQSMLTLLSKENPSGNPSITNPIPVGPRHEHATGFLQMLPSTFRAYAVSGHTNINNPVDNAAASARYQMATYHHLTTQSPYAKGGRDKMFDSSGKGKTFRIGDLSKRAWAVMSGMLPGRHGGSPPAMVIAKLNAGTGTRGGADYAHATRVGGNRIALSGEFAADLRDSNRPQHSLALSDLIHEWVHTQQKPELAYAPTWVLEGGAEGWTRDHAARIWRAANVPYHDSKSYSTNYTGFVERVRKTRGYGKRFLNNLQFIGGAAIPQALTAQPTTMTKGPGFDDDTGTGTIPKAARGRRFDSGGRNYLHPGPGQSTRHPIVPKNAKQAKQWIRGLAHLQTDRIPLYEKIIGDVDDENTRYSLVERKYDQSVEELIRPDGTVDEAAVKRRGDELLGLISIRQHIVDKLKSAVRIAAQIVASYTTILSRLGKSLAHAKKKDRGGIRAMIDTYTGRRNEWVKTHHDVATDTLPSAKLDLSDLKLERAGVLGTHAETPTADTPADVTPDTTPADTTPSADAQAQSDQALAQLKSIIEGARINAAVLRAFASPGDIGTGGRTALEAAGGSVTPAQVATLSSPQVPAGFQPTVIQQIQTNFPPTLQMLRDYADVAVSGIGLQPARTVSTDTLGY